jgi:hypothetical protein
MISTDDSAKARDRGLRRLTRLTWQTAALSTAATVGIGIVFARSPEATQAEATGGTGTPSKRAAAGPYHVSWPHMCGAQSPPVQHSR